MVFKLTSYLHEDLETPKNYTRVAVTRIPYLSSSMMRDKLSKGIGHNIYGEPAWPNDILYIFPTVILGSISCVFGLAFSEPTDIAKRGCPIATPIEILPEWYLFPTFNMLRMLPDKLTGVLSMIYLPAVLLILPFGENLNRYQNPFRRPIMTSIYISTIVYSTCYVLDPWKS